MAGTPLRMVEKLTRGTEQRLASSVDDEKPLTKPG
jgi:hypothetical protein